MISNAFKGAVQSEVGAQNNVINTATTAVKDVALIAGMVGLSATGASATGMFGRVGGIGGKIMEAAFGQKVDSAKALAGMSPEVTGAAMERLAGEGTDMEALSTVYEKIEGLRKQQAEKDTADKLLKYSKEELKHDND